MATRLSSLLDSPLKIALAVLAAAVVVLAWILKRGVHRTATSTSSWKSYIGGQGTLLFGFLAIGVVLAWISSYFGSHPSRITRGKLVTYRVDPSKGVLIEEQDTQNYQHITVLAQASEPQDGSATITMYGQSTSGGKSEIGRIETATGEWTRWDEQNSSKHLTVTIATGAGAKPATVVEVFVFLSPE